MKTQWMVMMVMAVVLSAMNVGCKTLEEYQALERANSVLEEDLARAKQDLLDCEHMNRQKDTMLESKSNELAAKNQMIGSLNDEIKTLRDALASAQAILEKQIAIRNRAEEIFSVIDGELRVNQKRDKVQKYSYPNYSEITASLRLDACIYDRRYKQQIDRSKTTSTAT